jgi:hypothetical protein
MRKLVWIAAFAAFAQVPVAYAQSENPTYAQSENPTYAQSGASAMMPSSENCGTPDEPKACPPLPRHPLKTYRGDR